MTDLTAEKPVDVFEGVICVVGVICCRTKRDIVVADLAYICREFPTADTVDMLCTHQAHDIMMAAYGWNDDKCWYDLTNRQVLRLVSDIEKMIDRYCLALRITT